MIVPMKRITLVAHKADEAAILKALQATQSVEILKKGDTGANVSALERTEARVDLADRRLGLLRFLTMTQFLENVVAYQNIQPAADLAVG